MLSQHSSRTKQCSSGKGNGRRRVLQPILGHIKQHFYHKVSIKVALYFVEAELTGRVQPLCSIVWQLYVLSQNSVK